MRRFHRNIQALRLTLLLVVCHFFSMISWSQQLYPAIFDIGTLNGTNGFLIPGIQASSQFGAETKFIGDINNDGFDDIAVGVNNADINGLDLAGAAYVIFGTNTGIPTSFDITTLNGANGFAVEGKDGSKRLGQTVEGLGDINGDGIDDLAILTSSNAMVIYGKTSAFPAVFDIDYANGVNGFLIEGFAYGNELANVGDINGDNINDFAISRATYSQCIWVFFGKTTNFPAILNATSIDGVNGFAVKTYSNSSIPGFLVGGAGDINNDGIDDLIIGDWSSGFSTHLERTFLVYGRNTFSSLLDVEAMSITEGFTVDHTGGNFLAFTGALGDINNDGIDDFFSEQAAIYGKTGASPFAAHVPLSSVVDGTYGFVLPGKLTSAPIGDINSDGINDFISAYNSNRAYVVFGSTTGFTNPIDETTLDGTNGFIIPNLIGSNIGRPVSGDGDFNGDGISDFLVGSPGTKSGTPSVLTGQVTVVFGGDHYANPLTTHVVRNVTTSGFTFVVNGPETGSIHYAIFPGTTAPVNNYNTILSGTGAVAHGSFLMDTANTDISEIISSLSPDTTYDVYLFLEDAAGNQGEIFSGDNLTTLAEPTAPFITTWETTTANESITIPTIGLGHNYTIDWGDGTVDANQTGNASHIYTTAGVHTVSISGDFPRIFFNNSGDKDKILTIEQWGDIAWTSMNRAFYGCINLNITNLAIDSPDLSLVTDLSFMFAGTNSFNAPLSNWDVSNVENMAFLFSGALIFNQDLNTWDVSAVRSMYNTFNYTFDFNGDITNWDVSNVEDMRYMFAGARAFNQDIGGWNIGSLKYIHGMFSTTDAFNQDVSSWDVSQLTDLSFVFNNAMAFDQNLGAWQIQNATNLSYFFNENALSVANYDATLKAWSAQSLQSGVNFRGGYSKYCTAEAERQSMIDTYGWTIYDKGKVASPVIAAITDVDVADSYTLPTIAGTNLTGNEKYYTQTGGTGTAYEIGDVLNYADFATYPVSIYAYDPGNGCGDSEMRFNLVLTESAAFRPFITTWETTTANESITVPTTGTGYNYTIDWGDGTVETNQTGDATHIYATAGTHTVSISGDFPSIYFNNTGDKDKIQSIEQWGDIAWTSMRNAFYGCSNINITNTSIDVPDLSSVTNMAHMFAEASVFDAELNSWDVSHITTMYRMFYSAHSFNQDLSNWDVSSVTNMGWLFHDAKVFNQDIGSWDVSNVTSMARMFSGATAFNQDISSWDVSSVTVMTFVFLKANSFNQDISSWDVSNVKDMSFMFAEATSFNQNINAWNVSNLNYMNGMFSGATAFNQDISSWDVSSVINMTSLFANATAFNQALSSWDVSNVTEMKYMFYAATSFDQNLGNWNVELVTDMSEMFKDVALSVANYDALLKGWSAQNLQSGVAFDGGNSQYCTTETERQDIMDTFGWTITDGGKVATPVIAAITDVDVADSYTLPSIVGANLSGNQKYYTQTGGAGTAYEIGDVLSYADFSSYPVTLYAYDLGTGCGASEESFNVTITLTDTTNPTASNPAAVNVQCLADVPAADINVVTDEADDSGIAPTVAYVSDVSDGNSNPETITRTYRVEDAAGNFIDVEQIITINDTTNPTASTPASIHVECSGDVPSVDISVISDASDNCSTPIITFISDVSDGNSNPETITRTYRVEDAAGNFIDVEQIITINDTTNPTARTPASIHVECSGDVPSADISVISDASDNCSTPTVIFISDVSDGNTNPETITRTYSVTDAAGNFIDVAQIITINDTTNPTASNPASIHVECSGDVPSADILVVSDASDNCSTPTITFISDVSDGNSNPETINRTYRVTDAAGNSIYVEQIITINDTTNPTASTPASIHVECSGDVPSADISVINDASDNCSAPTVTFISDVSDGNSNPETITRTYRVSDEAGNFIDVEQIITINDTTNPTVNCVSDFSQYVAANMQTAMVTYAAPVGTDNCSATTTTQIEGLPSGAEFPIGVTTNTFEISDASGNTVSCSFQVTILLDEDEEDEEELVCSINAGTDVEIEQGEAAQLEAMVSNVGSVVWYPATGLSNNGILNPIASPTETTSYTVYYTSNQGCTVEDTVTVYVIKKQEDETKYGFSPNGDGVNDYWEIHGIEQYPKNKVSIFNRWGDLVFETEGYNNSSKVFRGIANRKRQLGADALPEGTYFFNIKIEGQHHLKKETGFLVLKR